MIAEPIWRATDGMLTDADTQILWLVFGNPLRLWDSWEDVLKGLELKPDLRHNITQVFDRDGNPEWRVRSMYLLTKVIGIAPERVNVVHQCRLGTVMRKLGWSGPKNIWFGQEQAKGYFGGYSKAAEDASP
jgi:hypothetical protein